MTQCQIHDEALDRLRHVYDYLIRTEPWFPYYKRHWPETAALMGGHFDAIGLVLRIQKELHAEQGH